LLFDAQVYIFKFPFSRETLSLISLANVLFGLDENLANYIHELLFRNFSASYQAKWWPTKQKK